MTEHEHVFDLKTLGCNKGAIVSIDTNKPGVSESLQAGIMKGYCHIIKKNDVIFNVGSLMDFPTGAVCTNLGCRFHIAPYHIKT